MNIRIGEPEECEEQNRDKVQFEEFSEGEMEIEVKEEEDLTWREDNRVTR